MASPRRVVIAGAGVAALEAVLGLRALAGNTLEIDLIAPGDSFLYDPVTVAEAFAAGEARAFDLGEILRDQGVKRHVDAVARVDTELRVVHTRAGSTLRYDDLIVALGARARTAIPGALTFRGRTDVPALRAVVDDLASGAIERLAFAVPREGTWTLPAYEMALLATSHVADARRHGRVQLVTPEAHPLELFGDEPGGAVTDLLASRGIALHTQARPTAFADGLLRLAGGATIAADRVVALPLFRGPAVEGLPQDPAGFIAVDAFGRVIGVNDVYAAGDATAFPLKQGGLASQQADAIVEVIAGRDDASVHPRPFRPVIRGLLLTGGEPIYLRAGATAGWEPASVAGDQASAPSDGPSARRRESSSSTRPLWWPPSKIAGRYLAPYLATARPEPSSASLLADHGAPPEDQDRDDAMALALLLADYDARWGDLEAALAILETAASLGDLPDGYRRKRLEWIGEVDRDRAASRGR